MNYGKVAEDFVEHLCGKSFFADFTFRSPEYQKQGGERKEAADLLIVFRDILLAVQVKSKQLDSRNEQFSVIEEQRLWSKVDHAMHQFRALAEALNNPTFQSFKNGKGDAIAFDRKKITNIVLLVVFAPIWDDPPDNGIELKFPQSCLVSDAPIPLHLFTLKQFRLLMTLLDTLPDFLRFLEVRSLLHHQKLIPRNSDPIDEWAFLTFEKAKCLEVIQTRTPENLDGKGKQYADSLPALDEKEKPSYMVDRWIEEQSIFIGSDVAISDDLLKKATVKPNSVESFHLLTPLLAKLNREERGQVAKGYLRCLERFKDKTFTMGEGEMPWRFTGLKFEHHDEGYLVFVSTLDIQEAQVAASGIAIALGHKLKVKLVIALIGRLELGAESPIDMVAIDLAKHELKPEHIAGMEQLFGVARIVQE